MRKPTACVVIVALLLSLSAAYSFLKPENPVVAADSPASAERQLAHMVFFTLKDRSAESRQKLAGLCRKYLNDHPGTVYFSVGTIAEEFQREVNDREFDVALHVVFKNKQFHDDYQVAPRHLSFVEEGKPLWAKVRVFDSYLQ
jgi:hypothetical protein